MIFIYGSESFLIDQKVSQIIKNSDLVPIFFDEESYISDIETELLTISIFDAKKFLIFKNINAFDDEEDAKKILNIILKSSDDFELVFVCNKKVNSKNNLVHYLLNNAKCYTFNAIDKKEIINFIKEKVQNYNGKISYACILKLIDKIPWNLYLFNNELNKLLSESLEITEEIIDKSVIQYFKDDFFGLTNAITSNENKKILTKYSERIKFGDDPSFIINQIAKILSFVYIIFFYKNLDLNNRKIAELMDINAFRVKKAMDILQKTNIKKIKIFLKMLYELDQKIKLGKINRWVGLDHFILNLVK